MTGHYCGSDGKYGCRDGGSNTNDAGMVMVAGLYCGTDGKYGCYDGGSNTNDAGMVMVAGHYCGSDGKYGCYDGGSNTNDAGMVMVVMLVMCCIVVMMKLIKPNSVPMIITIFFLSWLYLTLYHFNLYFTIKYLLLKNIVFNGGIYQC